MRMPKLPRPLASTFDPTSKTNRRMRRSSRKVPTQAWVAMHRLIKAICPGNLRRRAIIEFGSVTYACHELPERDSTNAGQDACVKQSSSDGQPKV